MLILMRSAEPFGVFVGRSGEPIPIPWFAREVNASPREVRACISDLERNNVFSRDSQGRIYSRRLVTERARIEQARENGRLGGNPVLIQHRDNRIEITGQPSTRLTERSTPPTRDARPEPRSQNTDSLRSSAIGFREWPGENAALRELSLLFLAAFGNCFDPAKAERHLPAYMQVLAQMRGRGVSLAEAWQACSDARDANNDKPLFSAAIRAAMSFIPPRVHGGPRLRVVGAPDDLEGL